MKTCTVEAMEKANQRQNKFVEKNINDPYMKLVGHHLDKLSSSVKEAVTHLISIGFLAEKFSL